MSDYFKLDIRSAILIASHLINHKEFSISLSEVQKEGVGVMLRECNGVMKLCFDCCRLWERIVSVDGLEIYVDDDEEPENSINVDIINKEIVIDY